MTPFQAKDPYDWAALLAMIRRAFAGMEGRIDPPSSIERMTPEALAALSAVSEVWVIGRPARACVVLTPKPAALYIGRLAVDAAWRDHGYARQLVDLAAERARALGLPALELQVRVELLENHETFRAMGFAQTGETTHPGYTQPTSLVFTKPV
ncbi:GNAT family N-acetyltransferase [Rhodobacter ferrooxidans]|uniref:GCN5-related N-acetyltransferase n=1 Tax=Rhodobacter ferrooxidans TaxID=371731 RepID=C8RYR6_9RHOB|nr:GNAT family N-acetyltransferase [Rhodobacter sp. SW2]EEW26254.1 GCN5-related N-acetyltransferase [Rhodobacter sp. SW2]